MGNQNRLLLFLLLLLALVVFSRFAILLRGAFLIIVVVGALALLITGVISWIKGRQEEKAFRASPEGQIASRIEQCQHLIEANDQEIEDIQSNIAELEKALETKKEVRPANKQETTRVLQGFRQELRLRQARKIFYQTCLQKLDILQHNHELTRLLESKKEHLRKLQEENYEDLADMEEIKTSIEMDTFYLDTIDQLSQRILQSTSAEDASVLQLELEKMTRELDRRD